METPVKILLVEDDFVMVLASKTILSNAGYQVDVATSGTEAIRLSSANVYDLILMDLGLGDTTGYAVTEEIKSSGLNTQTPVVALTAHKKVDVEDNCLKIGMKAVQTKPLTLDIAKDLIATFVPKQ